MINLRYVALDAAGSQYHRYKVVKEIPGNLVETSFVENAFYENRGNSPGVQFSFSNSIDELIEAGYLEEIQLP